MKHDRTIHSEIVVEKVLAKQTEVQIYVYWFVAKNNQHFAAIAILFNGFKLGIHFFITLYTQNIPFFVHTIH